MFKEDKQKKIFGRRKGKKLSNLQQKNLDKYLNEFSIFPRDNDNIAKLKKINPYDLFHDLKIIFGISILIAIYAIIRNLDIIKIILIYWKDLIFRK